MLTVACVLVRGHVKFSPLYAIKLQAMVRRYLDRPFRFVCLTDQIRPLQRQMEVIPVATPHRRTRGWWAKIELFKPGRFEGRVVYLDLDTIVVKDLAPIVDYPSSFALIPDSGNWQGLYGLKVVKRFNSSVMVWDAGTTDRLHERFDSTVPKVLWGDQDFIGEQMPEADTMPLAWFPRLSELKENGPTKDARVVLCKHPKNHLAESWYPWVRQAWG